LLAQFFSLSATAPESPSSTGADPKTVRQPLGHESLEMTMKIYTRIRNQTKRQALGKLSYGQGTLAPDHVVEYPGKSGFSVQDGHALVTSEQEKEQIDVTHYVSGGRGG
jgi:hypothetical protein